MTNTFDRENFKTSMRANDYIEHLISLNKSNIHFWLSCLSESIWRKEFDPNGILSDFKIEDIREALVTVAIPHPKIVTAIKKANRVGQDMVNSPAHYQIAGMEVVDLIREATKDLSGPEGYELGNALKYLFRYQHKGNALQDLQKARKHINWLIDRYESEGDGEA